MRPKERSISWARTLYLLVALVLVSLALILLSEGRQLLPFEGLAGQVFTPIQQAVRDATSGIAGWIDTFGRMHDLEIENKNLRTALDSVTAENASLQQLKRENDQLRAMLKFQQARPDIRAVLSANIGGDPTGLMEIMTIDRGSHDGIKTGMAVVSPGGILIGQTSDVKPDRSTVLLITDVNSSIPVATQRTQDPGLMDGAWQKGGLMLVQHIPRDSDIKAGDMLLSSGVGGKFPSGLIAGQVLSVRQNDVQMEKEAEARPLVELNSLATVLVITGGGTP